MADDNRDGNSGVDFETSAVQVAEQCALVDECLLKLSDDDLFEVATGLSIREGRLKDQQGKRKSKLVMLSEISRHVERTCSESVESGLALLIPLRNDLVERLRKPMYVTSVTVEQVSAKSSAKKKKRKSKTTDDKVEVEGEEVEKIVDDSAGDHVAEQVAEFEGDEAAVTETDDNNDTSALVENHLNDAGVEEVIEDDESEHSFGTEDESKEDKKTESSSNTDSSDSEVEKSGELNDEEKKLELEMHKLQEKLRLVKMEKSAERLLERSKEKRKLGIKKKKERQRSPERKDIVRKKVSYQEDEEDRLTSPDLKKGKKKSSHDKEESRRTLEERGTSGKKYQHRREEKKYVRQRSPDEQKRRNKEKDLVNKAEKQKRIRKYKVKPKKESSSESGETSSDDERKAVAKKKKVSRRKKYSSSSESGTSSSEEDRRSVKYKKDEVEKMNRRHKSETTTSEDDKRTIKGKVSKKVRKKWSDSERTSSDEGKRKAKERVKINGKKKKKYIEPESSESEDDRKNSRKANKKKNKRRMKYRSESSGPESSRSLRRSDLISLRKAWRPPLKFTGQYGKTDDWSEFTSLKRAIDKAIKKEPPYEEEDIVEAALKSITAGTDLRKFLDGTPDLTLDLLIESLRSFYMEPDEKDLMRNLTKLRQGREEDAQRFVMRGLDLVHQFGSKKKSRVSESMAYEMLLESLETGFLNDNITHRMLPYLQNHKTSEKELLSAIKRAKKSEIDRKSKFDTRSARVNEVFVEDDRAIAAVLAKVEGIGADVAEVKQFVGNVKQQQLEGDQDKENTDPADKPKVIYGCKSCKAKGINRNCKHCFICEKDTHKAENCPDKKSSNFKRSPLGTQ